MGQQIGSSIRKFSNGVLPPLPLFVGVAASTCDYSKLTLVKSSTEKMHFSKLFLERLETQLLQHGFNQKQLAEGASLSQSAITKYKKGTMPGSEELARIADFLSVSTDYLLGRSPEQANAMMLRERPPEYAVDDLLQKVDNLLEQASDIKRSAQRLKQK